MTSLPYHTAVGSATPHQVKIPDCFKLTTGRYLSVWEFYAKNLGFDEPIHNHLAA